MIIEKNVLFSGGPKIFHCVDVATQYLLKYPEKGTESKEISSVGYNPPPICKGSSTPTPNLPVLFSCICLSGGGGGYSPNNTWDLEYYETWLTSGWYASY